MKQFWFWATPVILLVVGVATSNSNPGLAALCFVVLFVGAVVVGVRAAAKSINAGDRNRAPAGGVSLERYMAESQAKQASIKLVVDEIGVKLRAQGVNVSQVLRDIPYLGLDREAGELIVMRDMHPNDPVTGLAGAEFARVPVSSITSVHLERVGTFGDRKTIISGTAPSLGGAVLGALGFGATGAVIGALALSSPTYTEVEGDEESWFEVFILLDDEEIPVIRHEFDSYDAEAAYTLISRVQNLISHGHSGESRK